MRGFQARKGAGTTIILSGVGVRKEARTRIMEKFSLANKILFPCVSGGSERDLRGFQVLSILHRRKVESPWARRE
jgi:hypothetical protein